VQTGDFTGMPMYMFIHLKCLCKYWFGGERHSIYWLKRAPKRYAYLPVLTDIFWAIIRPPITASPVQRAWPRIPPTVTPITSYNKEITWNTTIHRCFYNCLHIMECTRRNQTTKWQKDKVQMVQDHAPTFSDGIWSVHIQENKT